MGRRLFIIDFGSFSIFLPVNEEHKTMADVGLAAVSHYQRAIGKTDIRLLRLLTRSEDHDEIIDWDEGVDGFLSRRRKHIVAIVDESERWQKKKREKARRGAEQSPPFPSLLPPTIASSSPISRHSIVEVNGFDTPPLGELRVSSESAFSPTTSISVHRPIRSSLRSDSESASSASMSRSTQRVTLSPDATRRLEMSEAEGKRERGMPSGNRFGPSPLTASASPSLSRGWGRKSKMSDSFYEAKERLEEREEPPPVLPSSSPPTSSLPSFSSTSFPVFHGRAFSEQPCNQLLPHPSNPGETLLILRSAPKTPIGIEVVGVEDDRGGSRLSALQIIRIDNDGRVGKDGQLRVGDCISELDGRPVYQMSLMRARAYLDEMESKTAPVLSVSRELSSFSPSASLLHSLSSQPPLPARPVLSALQQANTQEYDDSTLITIVKRADGLGFTVRSRQNAAGKFLFYVASVVVNGSANGKLASGDRLLQVNDEPTDDLQQSELVDRLRKVAVGDCVSLLVARVQREQKMEEKRESEVKEEGREEREEFTLSIPLNNTGSAGLGVSLKARVSVKADGQRHDCGIFVKKLLVGGAAFRDGRLRVDDRLIGIEGVDLRGLERNAEASEAITRELLRLGQTAHSVTLRIGRQIEGRRIQESEEAADETLQLTRTTLQGWRESEEREENRRNGESRDSQSEEEEEEHFRRESPSRRSVSEKRSRAEAVPFIAKRLSGPSPSGMSSSASYHGPSRAMSRAAEHLRSQSVHPRPSASQSSDRRQKTSSDVSPKDILILPIDKPMSLHSLCAITNESSELRRSDESGMDTSPSEPAVPSPSEPAVPSPSQPAVHSPRLVPKQSLRLAFDDSHLVMGIREERGEQKGRERERRKSMGSGLLRLFRSSKSKEHLDKQPRSPTLPHNHRQELSEEASRGQMPARVPVYSEFIPAYPNHFTPPSPLPQLRSPDHFVVANSKFYRSFASPSSRLQRREMPVPIATSGIATLAGLPSLSAPLRPGPPSPLRPGHSLTHRPTRSARPHSIHCHLPSTQGEREAATTARPSMPGSQWPERPRTEAGPALPPSLPLHRMERGNCLAAFPTTRFVSPAAALVPSPVRPERLSLRARKKLRSSILPEPSLISSGSHVEVKRTLPQTTSSHSSFNSPDFSPHSLQTPPPYHGQPHLLPISHTGYAEISRL